MSLPGDKAELPFWVSDWPEHWISVYKARLSFFQKDGGMNYAQASRASEKACRKSQRLLDLLRREKDAQDKFQGEDFQV